MKLPTALLACALMTTGAANAATIIITYTGTVLDSFDEGGLFGPPDTSLDGLDYTAVYRLTVPTPGARTKDSGKAAQIWGGLYFFAPSPVSARLTIGGVTIALAGAYSGLASQGNDAPVSEGDEEAGVHYDWLEHVVGDSDATTIRWVGNSIISRTNQIVATQDYTAPLDYRVQEGDNSESFFSFTDNVGTPEKRRTSGSLQPQRVTIVPFRWLPEPATWAMMLGGFALVGAAMRAAARKGAEIKRANR